MRIREKKIDTELVQSTGFENNTSLKPTARDGDIRCRTQFRAKNARTVFFYCFMVTFFGYISAEIWNLCNRLFVRTGLHLVFLRMFS